MFNLDTYQAPKDKKVRPDQAKVHRSQDKETILSAWVDNKPIPFAWLFVRIADRDGVWLRNKEHECLPDMSCCAPQRLWSEEERKLFVKSNPDERMRMCMAFLEAIKNGEVE